MNVIVTRVHVADDGTIGAHAPGALPPGDHLVEIKLVMPAPTLPGKPCRVEDLPVHDLGPWPEGLSLRRLAEAVPFGGRQGHDANIVATMLAHGVRRLLTFNVGDFRRFTGMLELEPITAAWDAGARRRPRRVAPTEPRRWERGNYGRLRGRYPADWRACGAEQADRERRQPDG